MKHSVICELPLLFVLSFSFAFYLFSGVSVSTFLVPNHCFHAILVTIWMVWYHLILYPLWTSIIFVCGLCNTLRCHRLQLSYVFSIENIFGFFFHCSVLWISHFLVWLSEENTETKSCCKRKVKSGVMIHFWMYQNIMKFRIYYLLIWQHGTSRIDRNFDGCKLLNVFSKCQGRLLDGVIMNGWVGPK